MRNRGFTALCWNICQQIVNESTIEMSTNTSLLAWWTDSTPPSSLHFSATISNLARRLLAGTGSDQISQVLLEEGEEGGQVMFVGIRMSETVTFARVNLEHNFGCYLQRIITHWAWLRGNDLFSCQLPTPLCCVRCMNVCYI